MGTSICGPVVVVAWMVLSACLAQAKTFPVGGSSYGWFDPNQEDFEFQEKWADYEEFHVNDVLDFGKPLSLRVVWMAHRDINCVKQNPPFDAQPIPPSDDSGNVTMVLSPIGELYFFSDSYFSNAKCNLAFSVKVEEHVKRRTRSHLPMILGVSVSAGFVIVVAVFAFLLSKARRRRAKQDSKGINSSDSERSTKPMFPSMKYFTDTTSPISDDVVVNFEWPVSGTMTGPKRFSLRDLRVATQSFRPDHVIGEGGFGTVYRGSLLDSPGLSVVAVKRLSQYARQGVREFLAEMNIISQLRHRNLVPLLGWCDEGDELILVYEYMPNGDLDDLIFGGYGGSPRASRILPWKHRKNILCGVARALVYLHEEWEQRVVHRDVKTSNVMLDSQFNARLGDFGLARLCSHSQAPRTTMVAGTIGYLAPEFSLTGKATDKTDVYAFGVVLLEVLSARRPLTTNCILVDWVWELHKEGKLLNAMDPKLDSNTPEDEREMKLFLQVGLLCSHLDASSRPDMRTVLNVLTGQSELLNMPRSRPVACYAEAE